MDRLPDPTPPDAYLRDHQQIDGHEFFAVESPAFEVECAPRGYENHVKVITPLQGGLVLRQGHRKIEVPAGSFVCLDLAHAFEMSSTSGQLFQWRVPKEVLTQRHPQLDWQAERAIGTANAGERWVSGLLLGFAHELPRIKKREQRLAVNALVEAMSLAPQLRENHPERRRVSRARGDLKRDLRHSDLDPNEIAERQGVSRRYLDALMRKHTGRTLTETIRHERLKGAAGDLLLYPERSALEVALSWGFENASHFARVFRAEFAMSPTAYRCRPKGRISSSVIQGLDR
jgi:AraC-like DNA-binding protein